jgi:hypothetical protein
MRAPTAREIAATARAESKRRRDHLLAIVRCLDMLAELAEDGTLMWLDAGVLREQRAELQAQADRIGVQLRTREWLYVGLLQAAENAGVDLGYTSPATKGKPFGPGIDYLTAAAATHGYRLGPNRAHRLLAEFNRLPRAAAKLAGTGGLRASAVILRKCQLIDE